MFAHTAAKRRFANVAAACGAVCFGSYLSDKSVFAVLIDLIKMLRILPHSFINADTSCMSG